MGRGGTLWGTLRVPLSTPNLPVPQTTTTSSSMSHQRRALGPVVVVKPITQAGLGQYYILYSVFSICCYISLLCIHESRSWSRFSGPGGWCVLLEQQGTSSYVRTCTLCLLLTTPPCWLADTGLRRNREKGRGGGNTQRQREETLDQTNTPSSLPWRNTNVVGARAKTYLAARALKKMGGGVSRRRRDAIAQLSVVKCLHLQSEFAGDSPSFCWSSPAFSYQRSLPTRYSIVWPPKKRPGMAGRTSPLSSPRSQSATVYFYWLY